MPDLHAGHLVLEKDSLLFLAPSGKNLSFVFHSKWQLSQLNLSLCSSCNTQKTSLDLRGVSQCKLCATRKCWTVCSKSTYSSRCERNGLAMAKNWKSYYIHHSIEIKKMGISLRGQRMLGIVFVAVAYISYSIPDPSFDLGTVTNPAIADLLFAIFLAFLVAGSLLIFRSYYSRVGRAKVPTQS